MMAPLAGVYGHVLRMRARGRYTRRYRFEHPTPAQFVATMREVLGDEAAKNLETAIFAKGWVDYRVTNAASSREESPAGVFDRDGKRETVAAAKPSGATFEGWAVVMR